jgi:phosphate starvation-inducible protein PhoH and related proteins
MARLQKVRRDKVAEGTHPRVNRKAESWQEQYGLHSFKLTDSQKELCNKIAEHTLTFVDAVAGSGKSTAVLYYFVREYLSHPQKKIIVIRTPVEAGGLDKIGFLPNELSAKVEPHFASSRKILEQLMSKSKVEVDLDNRIFFKIPNYELGATWDNSLVLIDEAQALQPMIMKLLLERVGVDSKVVVVGDSNQLYASEAAKRNGLKDALTRFLDPEMEPKFNDVAFHTFTVDDVQRSEIVKTVIRAYQGFIN